MSFFFVFFYYSLVILTFLLIGVKFYIYITTGRYKIRKSLKGRHILITGGTSGIGKETVRELAKHGATVHVLARENRAETLIEELKRTGDVEIDLHGYTVDLTDFQSVRRFARLFLATESPIHVLINNAGIANSAQRLTLDGNDEVCQVNHLSHFLLTSLLLERIVESGPGARIINVSSGAHHQAKHFDVTDLNFEHQPYGIWAMNYCCSKLENILFTRELARRVYGKGVTVNCLHPGVVRTNFLRDFPRYHPLRLILSVLMVFTKSAVDGAQTSIYLATSDEVTNVSGHYFLDCKPGLTSLLALDDKLASDLWNESVRLTNT